jgi:hypothetical protein
MLESPDKPAARPDAVEPAAEPGAASTGWRPGSFVERVGAALVAPRAALAEADEPHSAGTAGSDVAALIGLVFAATYTREIVIAVWLGAVESIRVGAQALAGTLARAVAWDLAVLFIAAFALTVTAGGKRAMGRDFDLACVAFIPLLTVRLGTELITRLGDIRLSEGMESAVGVLGYGWAAAVLVLAWGCARRRDEAGPAGAGSNAGAAS